MSSPPWDEAVGMSAASGPGMGPTVVCAWNTLSLQPCPPFLPSVCVCALAACWCPDGCLLPLLDLFPISLPLQISKSRKALARGMPDKHPQTRKKHRKTRLVRSPCSTVEWPDCQGAPSERGSLDRPAVTRVALSHPSLAAHLDA